MMEGAGFFRGIFPEFLLAPYRFPDIVIVSGELPGELNGVPAMKEFFQVAYVNWRGVWTMDVKTFAVKSKAAGRAAYVAKRYAENGRVSVRVMYR